jgi:hypothetical protein
MEIARHEHPPAQSCLDRMQAASLGVPEGDVRDQFTGFVVQVSNLFDKYGAQSEAEFLGAKWSKKTYPDLSRYGALIDKLNEILDTMETVTDHFEYEIDVSAYKSVEAGSLVGEEVPILITTNDDKIKLLDKMGEVVVEGLEDADCNFHEKGECLFIEKEIPEGEAELIDYKGRVVVSGFESFCFEEVGNEVMLIVSFDEKTIGVYTSKGKPLFDHSIYSLESSFIDRDESIYCISKKEGHGMQLIDGEGNPIGKEYWFIAPLHNKGSDVLARVADRTKGDFLLGKDGKEIPLAEGITKVIPLGQKDARLCRYENGGLFVHDLQGELVFGPDKHKDLELRLIKETVVHREKTYLIVEANYQPSGQEEPERVQLLLDEDGNFVPIGKGEIESLLARSINVEKFVGENVYFNVAYKDECCIVDQKGEVYATSQHSMTVVAEKEELVLIYERFEEDSRVVDQNGEIYFSWSNNRHKSKGMYFVGDKVYFHAATGQFEYLFESKDRGIALGAGGDITIIQDRGAAFAIVNPGGLNTKIINLETEKKTPSEIDHIVKETLVGSQMLFMASEDGVKRKLYNHERGAYKLEGDVMDFIPLGESFVAVLCEYEGKVKKSIIEV